MVEQSSENSLLIMGTVFFLYLFGLNVERREATRKCQPISKTLSVY